MKKKLPEQSASVTRLCPGAQLRYFTYADKQLVASIDFGTAAWQTAPRNQFIGWSHEQRKNNLHLVVNDTRFLISPWIKSRNLASKILSITVRSLPDDWEERYNIRPVLLKTCVETKRFTGNCYKSCQLAIMQANQRLKKTWASRKNKCPH